MNFQAEDFHKRDIVRLFRVAMRRLFLRALFLPRHIFQLALIVSHRQPADIRDLVNLRRDRKTVYRVYGTPVSETMRWGGSIRGRVKMKARTAVKIPRRGLYLS